MRTGGTSYGANTGFRKKERSTALLQTNVLTDVSFDEGATWIRAGDDNRPVSDSTERIVYENSNKKQFGNCFHVKSSRWRPLAGTVVVPGQKITNDWVTHRYSGVPGVPLGIFPDRDPNGRLLFHVEDPPAWDISTLLVSAHNDMRPKIEQEISVINFLLELGDLPSLVTWPWKTLNPRAWRKLSRLNFKTLSKAIADASLWYGFAVRPTLADLYSLYSVYTDFKKKIDDLIANQGKPCVRHWSPNSGFHVDYDVEETPSSDENWRVQTRTRETSDSRFTCTLKYVYEFRDPTTGRPLTQDAMYWRGLLDSMGIYRNPQIVWDAIPFTFLVDWVVGVGDWLSGFAERNLEPSVTILDACYSTKQARLGYGYLKHSTVRYGEVTGTVYEGEGIYSDSAYQRCRYVPTPELLHGTPLPDLQSPSWRKWWLGTSLIVAWRT